MSCNCNNKPKLPKNYFDSYTDLEKQIVLENLGMTNGSITVENYPDEEDLTKVENGTKIVLKFKDKEYDPDNHSGYGHVILRKNIIDGKNVLLQSAFQDENKTLKDHTIYIVQYDFDLNNQYVKLPENSILIFAGGSIFNGTLLLNGVRILPFGINLSACMFCKTSGDYAEGQVIYKDEKLMFYNGTKWYDISGIVTIDTLTEIVNNMKSTLDSLVTSTTASLAAQDKKISDFVSTEYLKLTGGKISGTLYVEDYEGNSKGDAFTDTNVRITTNNMGGELFLDDVDNNSVRGTGDAILHAGKFVCKGKTSSDMLLGDGSTIEFSALMNKVPSAISFNIADKVSTDGATIIADSSKISYGTAYHYISFDGSSLTKCTDLPINFINYYNSVVDGFAQNNITYLSGTKLSALTSVQLPYLINSNYRLYTSTQQCGTIATPFTQINTKYTYKSVDVVSNIAMEIMSNPIYNFNTSGDTVQVGLTIAMDVTYDANSKPSYSNLTSYIVFHKVDNYIQSVTVES